MRSRSGVGTEKLADVGLFPVFFVEKQAESFVN
jgi:hypothetical protein